MKPVQGKAVVQGNPIAYGPSPDIDAAVGNAKNQMNVEFQATLIGRGKQAGRQPQSIKDQVSVLEATSKEVHDNWEAA